MSPTRRKKPARKPAGKRTTRRPARRTAAKPARRASGSRRASATQPAKRKRRLSLRVVRAPRPVRRARAATSAASFPQREGASPKQLVLFELIRARAAFLAAIHGMSPGAANEPMGEGRWSVRETVLHLVTRDQARLRESESALHGRAPSWKGIRDPEMAALNAQLMAPLLHLDWEDALRTLFRVREQLMEEVESVPEEPAEVWSQEHAFGWMLYALPPHDRHHADTIKRWRVERGV